MENQKKTQDVIIDGIVYHRRNLLVYVDDNGVPLVDYNGALVLDYSKIALSDFDVQAIAPYSNDSPVYDYKTPKELYSACLKYINKYKHKKHPLPNNKGEIIQYRQFPLTLERMLVFINSTHTRWDNMKKKDEEFKGVCQRIEAFIIAHQNEMCLLGEYNSSYAWNLLKNIDKDNYKDRTEKEIKSGVDFNIQFITVASKEAIESSEEKDCIDAEIIEEPLLESKNEE